MRCISEKEKEMNMYVDMTLEPSVCNNEPVCLIDQKKKKKVCSKVCPCSIECMY